MGSVDKSDEFKLWITTLTRFTMNQPLPHSLYEKLCEEMIYHNANDRNKSFEGQDDYCP